MTPLKNWVKDLYRHFTKEGIEMVNEHMKGCSEPLVSREI